MVEYLKDVYENIVVFDLIYIIITLLSLIKCSRKGFILSFISFMKWILSIVLTIVLVPKFQPWVAEYIESEFINNVGLGIAIFILSLFTTILISRSLSRAVTWTGMGSVDKTFGLIFGVFKGYTISVCIFSLLNWFYPYQNWGISANKALSFDVIKKSSEVLIEEFPNNEDFINTKEKIEKI